MKLGSASALAAAIGCPQLATAFVAPTPGSVGSAGTSPALRGAEVAQLDLAAATSPAGSSTHGFGIVAAGATLAMAVAVTRKRSTVRSRKTDLLVRAASSEAAASAPFDPAKQIGAMAPLDYFDPLGFCKVGDEEGFRSLRVAELKHGRVAMLAALGGVVQHFIKFPSFEKVPSGMGALTAAPGIFGFAALFVFSGAMEILVWNQDPSKEPGNFGDPMGLGSYDEEMRSREINNGRFAMFAAIGIVSADLLTGKDAIQQFGF